VVPDVQFSLELMTEPQIILGGDVGYHNRTQRRSAKRVKDSGAYRDLSTVCVIPTRGTVPARVVESWMGLQSPMNQAFVRMFIEGMEVGAAYEKAVDTILNHDMLRGFRYMLTLEEDNVPPSDGLLRLFENIDRFAVVAGLYYTKGEAGMPMIYGDPKGILSFNPQTPVPGKVQECNGTGMGFTLFDLRLFREGKIERPFFRTQQDDRGVGTQDLYFAGKARQAGYRIASDNRVRVGHLDKTTGVCW
jgi:hypothetical protein